MPAALSCLFNASSSSFLVFRSLNLGSNFFCSALMSRWPSLVAKMACSTLMAAILVAVGLNAGAVGTGSAAPGAAGNAAEEEPPAWAKAATEKTTAAAMEHTNLSFMGSLNSFNTPVDFEPGLTQTHASHLPLLHSRCTGLLTGLLFCPQTAGDSRHARPATLVWITHYRNSLSVRSNIRTWSPR